MLYTVKRVQSRQLQGDDYKLLFPVMHWLSGDERNLEICNYINSKFFYADHKILIKTLSANLKYIGFTKYFKAKKFDTDKFDIVVGLIKKKYFLGPNDINSARKVIEKIISNKNELEKLSNEFGLDNKIRKKLGLSNIKFDKTKVKEKPKKGLFDY